MNYTRSIYLLGASLILAACGGGDNDVAVADFRPYQLDIAGAKSIYIAEETIEQASGATFSAFADNEEAQYTSTNIYKLDENGVSIKVDILDESGDVVDSNALQLKGVFDTGAYLYVVADMNFNPQAIGCRGRGSYLVNKETGIFYGVSGVVRSNCKIDDTPFPPGTLLWTVFSSEGEYNYRSGQPAIKRPAVADINDVYITISESCDSPLCADNSISRLYKITDFSNEVVKAESITPVTDSLHWVAGLYDSASVLVDKNDMVSYWQKGDIRIVYPWGGVDSIGANDSQFLDLSIFERFLAPNNSSRAGELFIISWEVNSTFDDELGENMYFADYELYSLSSSSGALEKVALNSLSSEPYEYDQVYFFLNLDLKSIYIDDVVIMPILVSRKDNSISFIKVSPDMQLTMHTASHANFEYYNTYNVGFIPAIDSFLLKSESGNVFKISEADFSVKQLIDTSEYIPALIEPINATTDYIYALRKSDGKEVLLSVDSSSENAVVTIINIKDNSTVKELIRLN